MSQVASSGTSGSSIIRADTDAIKKEGQNIEACASRYLNHLTVIQGIITDMQNTWKGDASENFYNTMDSIYKELELFGDHLKSYADYLKGYAMVFNHQEVQYGYSTNIPIE